MPRRLYLCPLAPVASSDTGGSQKSLAGSGRFFAQCEVNLRSGDEQSFTKVLPLDELAGWLAAQSADSGGLSAQMELALTGLTSPRKPFADLPMDRPQVMGIVNVTPDSFSDGGDRLDAGKAIDDGLAMWEAGASILDVGGESTRPGAEPVSEAAEIERVVPVIRGLSDAGARVSVDTRHAAVMRAAIDAGAQIVNDVTALESDPESLGVVAESGMPVVLMHMQGDPRTMQKNPDYADVVFDVFDYLKRRVEICLDAGIARDAIAVDVGIGFGKTLEHNLRLLDALAMFHSIGTPLLLGLSRKSFIAKLSNGEAPKERLAGSLAGVAAGLARGVQIFRVHDVAETLQMIAVWQAIEESS
ncbi:dihydropteroate synthase [Denitrobaculum tricleocarpae]|uniref:Dihydropteroate synthase n=1 Tax=Denitrobaculum tricleocarpae TaxID=2591009 RepID=A0A545TX05_9PROT|nr:dihydropteroate synthase [Denitrobaculum tricleocarpae]TQV81747.1 dihydropteroate synthase [Denitrobaculum tricleocarpae]